MDKKRSPSDSPGKRIARAALENSQRLMSARGMAVDQPLADGPEQVITNEPETAEVDVTAIGRAVYQAFLELDDRQRIMTEPMMIAWAGRQGAEIALRLQAETGEA